MPRFSLKIATLEAEGDVESLAGALQALAAAIGGAEPSGPQQVLSTDDPPEPSSPPKPEVPSWPTYSGQSLQTMPRSAYDKLPFCIPSRVRFDAPFRPWSSPDLITKPDGSNLWIGLVGRIVKLGTARQVQWKLYELTGDVPHG